MSITSNAEVAGKVRGIAAERKVPHVELAKILDVSRMSMSRRMNGVTPFEPQELVALSQRLDVPVGAFFGEVAA